LRALALIGIGRMGTRMAERLLRAGFAVRVHNRTPDKAASLIAGGATWCASPAEAARGASIVITMLAGPDASRRMILGPHGVLDGAETGALVIEMTTIAPATACDLAHACAEAGVAYLDCPVSGSLGAAAGGTLVALVGGDADVVARADGVLRHLTRNVVHLGPVGAGSAMKLALNTLLAIYNEGLSEALALAAAGGIARQEAWDVIAGTGLAAGYMKNKREIFLEPGDHETAFTIELMEKDAGLAARLASEHALALPALGASLARLRRALEEGRGHEDLGRVDGPTRSLRTWPARSPLTDGPSRGA
jgi:3-hydroxyisobutyrate dehydrogenase